MTLASGARLGPYEILAAIGAGGMGEVYRAKDPRLGRDVAIKLLPEAFASDAERLARFRREAQVLASLNHPHIAAIYGLAEADGVEALVLELVEGETLADRMVRGAMPLDEALEVARQIADALEAAHDRGIVHRDLKPANVKLTPAGEVKVLDFGLAKALSPETSSPDVSRSPTLTVASTQAGVVIGTAAYMSPEQARGRAVDKRADIWAFGAILWEMLTGRRLFEGDTVSDILAAVLRQDVDFAALPVETPEGIIRLLHRCLERDPRKRLHDVADARLEIEDSQRAPTRAGSTVGVRTPPATYPSPFRWVPWLVAAAAVIAAAAVTLFSTRRNPSRVEDPVRLSVALPGGTSLDPDIGDQTQILALSPDGRRIAFRGKNGQDRRIYVRDLSSESAVPVSGTESGSEPFFSPDGDWLGFVAGDKLKKTALAGGTPVTLATAPRNRGASWSDDGSIVFTPTVNAPLFRIPAAGGEARPVTKLDSVTRERTHRWPEAIPGEEWVLFTIGTEDRPGDYDDSRIDAVSLKTGKRHLVYRGASFARFAAPDRLLLARRGDILVAKFDPKTAQLRGAPVPAIQGVSGDARSGVSYFGIARTGTLTYVVGLSAQGAEEIVWMDRTGKMTPTGIPPGLYSSLALSPDGTKLAYAEGPAGGARSDVWIADLANASRFQLTSTGKANSPIWTPDGKSVVYATPVGDVVFRQRVDGSAPSEVIWRAQLTVPITTDSFVPDGSALLLTLSGLATRADVYRLTLTGDRAGGPFIATPEAEHRAMVSPDGRWVAYTGEYENGAQVYVQPYPGLAGRWQVSREGGAAARWSRDGRELFYVWNDEILAVPIRQAPGFAPGEPRAIFKIERPAPLEWSDVYDVAPDGKRFIVLVRARDPNRSPGLNVVLHFGVQAGEAAP